MHLCRLICCFTTHSRRNYSWITSYNRHLPQERSCSAASKVRQVFLSEIATVPGTVDLVELLFGAVLMLVSCWLVSSVSRSTRRAFGSCLSFFDVRFRSKKYAGHIFRTESEALAERPVEEGLEGQEPRGTRRVEDLRPAIPIKLYLLQRGDLGLSHSYTSPEFELIKQGFEHWTWTRDGSFTTRSVALLSPKLDTRLYLRCAF